MSGAVSVLFARRSSVYRTLGVDCWDIDRDARLYLGRGPVIAHPPCRMWGRYAVRAKGDRRERELALWAVQLVSAFGGVVEHPWSSALWKEADLSAGNLVRVEQGWWGHRAPKATGLFCVGCLPTLPAARPVAGGRVENLCRAEREATPPAFARWLLDLVSSENWKGTSHVFE